jgi:hypothetical protein
VQPSGEQFGCSGGVYPQDDAGDSGLGAALHSAVASTSWNEKEKVLKFVELTCLYPSLHGATWRMWDISGPLVSGPLGEKD